MKARFIIKALFAISSFVLFVTPAISHHSFAMYDQSKTVTWTGVMTRFVAQANHAEMHFVPLGPDGKPLAAAMEDRSNGALKWQAQRLSPSKG